MKKMNNQPGVISNVLKNIPDVFFENSIYIVLILLICLMPATATIGICGN